MESITFEITSAQDDPSDRTLCVRAMTGGTLVLATSYRVAPEVPLGTILLAIDRIALAWGRPSFDESSDLWDTAETLVQMLVAPF